MHKTVSRVVQDKVSYHGASPGGSMHTSIEGQINCACTNRDNTQVAVAGRNVFRIFSIEDDEFVERVNLRVGRNLNLTYSSSDVAWNPVEDNILASAATNGAVVTWDLGKPSKSKQDLIFQEHKRTVNRVSFHPQENNLLLSGSQDGYMKLFDLRKRESTMTFFGQSESVRDVQFSPFQSFMFATAFENGNVQIWDIRRPDRWIRQFVAHNDPVFTLDFHPDDKNWLATAGRDKTIKVWDLSSPHKARNIHSVQTIASVARVKWRPQRRYHIASCALLLDFSVNVWDIRRPYIPFAVFGEHRDVVTSIMWKNDPHVFLSGSKDQTIYQHVFRDAKRPADAANPTTLSISIQGNIAHAFQDEQVSGKGSKITNLFKKGRDRSEQFPVASSSLVQHQQSVQSVSEDFDMGWFVELAQRYRLCGSSLEDICEHNARVARDVRRPDEARVWGMLGMLYGDIPSTPVASTVSILSTMDQGPDTGKQNMDNSKTSDKKKDAESKKINVHADLSTGLSGDESGNASDSEQDRQLENIASGNVTQTADFLFGEGEMEQFGFESDNEREEDWILPSEVFTVRHEIADRSVSPDPLQMDSPSDILEESETNNAQQATTEQTHLENSFISKLPAMEFPLIDVSECTRELLVDYVDRSDVQMAVTILIVVGDKIRHLIDDRTQEAWYLSYIDLLGRFYLYSVAAEVIELSHIDYVRSLSQQSTMVHTDCGKCCKPLKRPSWVCERCNSMTSQCSICHMPVKGVFVWCQGCSHGGHLQHMKDWFKNNFNCPMGCGHICEYT